MGESAISWGPMKSNDLNPAKVGGGGLYKKVRIDKWGLVFSGKQREIGRKEIGEGVNTRGGEKKESKESKK